MSIYKKTSFLAFVLLVSFHLSSGKDMAHISPHFPLPQKGLCAHRGVMDTHPENTLPAFREAIRLGAHMIEFDVWFTKDNVPVIIHDPTVDRTTDGAGLVTEMTFAEIRRLDAGGWKSPLFNGVRVPTLQETLSIMPSNIWLNVHMKGGAEDGQAVARILLQMNRQRQAFLACKSDAAQAARAVSTEILICSMDRRENPKDYVNETITAKADFIQLRKPYRPDLAEDVKNLRQHGIQVNFFGTDSAEKLRELFAMGVQFPLVNELASSMQAAMEFGIQPVKPQYALPEIP